jgi:hypothetical protein
MSTYTECCCILNAPLSYSPILTVSHTKNKGYWKSFMCFLTKHMHVAQQCIFGHGKGVFGLWVSCEEPWDATTGKVLTNRETITFWQRGGFCEVLSFVMIVKVVIKVCSKPPLTVCWNVRLIVLKLALFDLMRVHAWIKDWWCFRTALVQWKKNLCWVMRHV